jgi:hypothetical protein
MGLRPLKVYFPAKKACSSESRRACLLPLHFNSNPLFSGLAEIAAMMLQNIGRERRKQDFPE